MYEHRFPGTRLDQRRYARDLNNAVAVQEMFSAVQTEIRTPIDAVKLIDQPATPPPADLSRLKPKKSR